MNTLNLLLSISIIFCSIHYILASTENDPQLQSESSDDEKIEEFKVFVPTKEWQVVRKGQPIPRGLHVRVNFETKVTEAKLFNPDELPQQDDKYQALTAVSEVLEPDDPVGDETDSEVKEALAKQAANVAKLAKLAQSKKIKSVFSNQVSKLMDEHDLLLAASKRGSLDQQQALLVLLDDLEHEVHDINAAIDFASADGLDRIVYPYLNSSEPQVRTQALFILGACVQNNPNLQEFALESGALGVLLKFIKFEKHEDVKYRAFYALGSLLAAQPSSEPMFVASGGLDICLEILESHVSIKFKIRIIRILENLARAHQDSQAINVKAILLRRGFCTILSQLLQEVAQTDPLNLDNMSELLEFMKFLRGECSNHYTTDDRDNLVTLHRNFDQILSDIELEDDGTLTESRHALEEIVSVLITRDEL